MTFKIAGLKKIAVSKVLENLDKPDKFAVSKVLENLDKPDKEKGMTVSPSFRIAVINQYREQNCVTEDKSV